MGIGGGGGAVVGVPVKECWQLITRCSLNTVTCDHSYVSMMLLTGNRKVL